LLFLLAEKAILEACTIAPVAIPMITTATSISVRVKPALSGLEIL
jgi:hypothetical protein